MTVSGLTKMRTSDHRAHRRRRTIQNQRSALVTRGAGRSSEGGQLLAEGKDLEHESAWLRQAETRAPRSSRGTLNMTATIDGGGGNVNDRRDYLSRGQAHGAQPAANRLGSALLRTGSDRLDRELEAKWTQEPVECLLSWIVFWRNCPQDVWARHANLFGKLAHAIGPNHLRENGLERDPFFDPGHDELPRKLNVAQVLRESFVPVFTSSLP